MQLATARRDPNTVLLARYASNYFEVLPAAAERDRSALEGVDDVGSLLRAGEIAWRAVERTVARASERSSATPQQPLDEFKLAPPVTHPGAILCAGRNYREHIAEGNVETPPFPVVFSKFPNALIGDKAPVVRHAITSALDYEGELALVIGRTASKVSPEDAWDYVAGFTIMNDISARDLQESDLQWIRGKSLDTFAPMGPTFISRDEVDDVDALVIETRVNGEVRQRSACGEMLFTIPQLLSFASEAITLSPGDVVSTGTPAGTGIGFDPPRYLEPGDVVTVRIDPIGTLRSPITQPE